jgi:hypothetical protein
MVDDTDEDEVGIQAFTHETVIADSKEEAVEKARDKTRLPSGWTVSESDPVLISEDVVE